MYHPDKNPGNEFSSAQFRELKEAYHILGNESRKAQYDHERWLSGRFKKSSASAITPEYLLKEAQKLNHHLLTVDIYRMNRQLLYEYLLFLLRDNHIGIVQINADKALVSAFVAEILRASGLLPYYYDKEILDRLRLLLPEQDPEQKNIHAAMRKRKRSYLLQKSFPWMVATVALLLCLFMYFFARRD